MRFDLVTAARIVPCFAVRFDGRALAYVNSCPHRGTELDWQLGEFFDESGLYLICATHGAAFDPSSGHCVSGPCAGERLFPVPVREECGRVVIQSDIGSVQSA
ncbi:MAG: Rieske 2Fe-2S domain-containing protein [Burkholderiales bacterium]|nr:Rieske 2Fe-2S domain-containing protein [Burkholderiales bacterium]